MPKAFELFGELRADTGQFDGALIASEKKLQALQGQLTQTEVGAKKLGSASRDLYRDLSSFQKTQLSFQLNDIITGLASGQRPLQVLAQQGGQVFQIFQMGGKAAKDTAQSIGLMTQMEAGLAISAAKAAESQAGFAVASKEAQASITLMGAPLGGIAATAALGAVAIGEAYVITTRIRKEAEERLALEMRITGEFNKQSLAAKTLQEELQKQRDKRNFQYFLEDADAPALLNKRAALQKEFDANRKKIQQLAQQEKYIAPELSTADSILLAGSIGISGVQEFNRRRAAALEKEAARKAEVDKLNARQELISSGIGDVEAQKDALQRENAKKNATAYADGLKDRIKAAEQYAKEVRTLTEKQDTYALDKVKNLEELKRFHYRTTAQTIVEAFDREVAIAKKREELVNKQIELQKKVADATEQVRKAQESYNSAFLKNAVDSIDAQDAARQFRQGHSDEEENRQRALARVGITLQNARNAGATLLRSPKDLLEIYLKQIEGENFQTLINKKIAAVQSAAGIDLLARSRELTSFLKPSDISKLDYNQRQIAAKAYDVVAKNENKELTDATVALKEATAALNLLREKGFGINVKDETANGKVSRVESPTPNATLTRYEQPAYLPR